MIPNGPTIYLVDDDVSILRALSRILRLAGYRVEQFSDPTEFLEADRLAECGCVLLDLAMPGLDGVQLHQALIHRGSPLPIIFLSGHGDIPASVRAMRRGAVDFLTKPVDTTALLGAIEMALRQNQATLTASQQRSGLQQRYASLTPREREVMRYVVAGKLNKQTAAELGTTEKTIKVHRGRIMEKMEAGSLPDLVRMHEQLALNPDGSRA